jgi:hypothetical protein
MGGIVAEVRRSMTTTEGDVKTTEEPEIAALRQVYLALKDLDADAQNRVLEYVARRLNLKAAAHSAPAPAGATESVPKNDTIIEPHQNVEDVNHGSEEELDGISPVAKKWMRRNGLDGTQLASLFSLGGDEIDLVAKKVPGKGKKDKMRSVFLLKGVAAYLGSGAPRFKDEEVRETCEHYGAYDQTNFASSLKSFASIVSGTKASGYTLTTRGLTEATELLKEITGQAQGKAD